MAFYKNFLLEIIHQFRFRKKQFFAALIGSQLVPILEAAFISTLYLIFNQEKKAAFFAKIEHLISISNTSNFTFIFSFFLLLTFIIVKLLNERLLLKIQIQMYSFYTKQLTSLYLYSSIKAAKSISRDKLTDSIVNDGILFANTLKRTWMVIGALSSTLIYLTTSLYLSWKMLLISIGIFAIPLILNRRIYKKIQSIGSLKVTYQEDMLSFFIDLFKGFNRVKLDGLETDFIKKSNKVIKNTESWRLEKHHALINLNVSMDALSFLGLLLVIFIGVEFLHIELSLFMILFIIFNRLKSHINLLSQTLLVIKERMPQINRYLAFIEKLQSNNFDSFPERTKDPISKVECRNISFQYKKDHPLFNDINLTLNKGDIILIQGESGCGKSTLLELICGILFPTKGKVYLNDKELSDQSFFAFRDQIAYISPEIHLFQSTFKDNIFMSEEREDKDIDKALKFSGLDEVIKNSPKGIESDIGQSGSKLSLGQRMRLVWSRIFHKSPSLILLDEATANLDIKLENKLFSDLIKLVNEKQSILVMIAHKKPDNINFTKHFVLENGKLKVFSSN